MGRQRPQLSCKNVKLILKNLGFSFKNQKGSHEHFILRRNGKLFKVTVDCPKQPFSDILVASMARQAGVTKDVFYAALQK